MINQTYTLFFYIRLKFQLENNNRPIVLNNRFIRIFLHTEEKNTILIKKACICKSYTVTRSMLIDNITTTVAESEKTIILEHFFNRVLLFCSPTHGFTGPLYASDIQSLQVKTSKSQERKRIFRELSFVFVLRAK